MHPRDLTPVEIADLFDAAYRQDRGLTREGLNLEVRLELADYLGCHPNVQAEAWAAWREQILMVATWTKMKPNIGWTAGRGVCRNRAQNMAKAPP